QREGRVVGDVPVVEGVPTLVAGHPENAVPHVVVQADDVGVLVVDVVVGLLPVLGGAHDVPLPGGGVDLGVVHPVPLPVHDVVAEFHVLDDLGDPEGACADRPGRAVT